MYGRLRCGFLESPMAADHFSDSLNPRPKPLKKRSKKITKKWWIYSLYIMARAFVSVKSSFFFSTFFALFSPIICQSDGFSGIRIVSLILICLRSCSPNGKKKVGYQKSCFLIFLVCFFVINFVDFERKSRFRDNTATFWPLWGWCLVASFCARLFSYKI